MTSDDAHGFGRQDGPGESETLLDALTTLRTVASGVGFIYEALNLVARRFALDDLVIVFQDDTVGTQIFRLGGGSVSPDRIELVNAPSGVYCEPSVVSSGDEMTLYRICREELVTSGARRRPKVAKKLAPVGAVQATSEVTMSRTMGGDVAGDDIEVTPSQPFAFNVRRALSQVFVVVDIAVIMLVLLSVHGPVRFFLGLVLGVAIPGWAIVGLMKFENAPLEIALSMTVSLSLIMVGAQVMMFLQWWHLAGFEVIVCLVCLPSLLWQARRRPGVTRTPS